MNDLALTPELLLNAYLQGAFPMAEHAGEDAEILFYRPDPRTLLTVVDCHIPRRLRRFIRQTDLTIRFPDNVTEIMQECGRDRDDGTWINQPLIDVYTDLAQYGYVAAIGVYQGHQRVGGLYWVQMGMAVMAESMFSRVPNASKLAVIGMLAALRHRAQRLALGDQGQWMDVQYSNPHLEQFHPTSLSADEYQSSLGMSCSVDASGFLAVASFLPDDFAASSVADFVQFKTQIS
jgi:leucyl/phenylalanyl-tRNA---protein transferase